MEKFIELQLASNLIFNETDIPRATAVLEKYIGDKECEWAILGCLGNLAVREKKNNLAVYYFEKALKVKPDCNELKINLGAMYRKVGKLEKSRKILSDLAKKHPSSEVYANLAATYYGEDDVEKVKDFCLKAIELDPDNLYARFNLCHYYLSVGNYELGFTDYWSREKTSDRKVRDYHRSPSLHWDGAKDKKVLVYGEQGLGDEIMFASILPDLICDSKEVVFEANGRLADLFRKSFPGLKVYGTKQTNKLYWPHKEGFDCVCGISDLAEFYRKKKEDFPGNPYISPDQDYEKYVREKYLSKIPDKPLVGFSWKGGAADTNANQRYISLDKWKDIFNQDANFISLQYHADAEDEILKLPKDIRNKIFHWKEIIDDYEYTAALLSQIEIIITAPQSVVHLAGAMGVETIQLCPKKCIWQMGPYGEDMPWYKSVKNIWQKEAGDWKPVLNKAKKKLIKKLGAINEINK